MSFALILKKRAGRTGATVDPRESEMTPYLIYTDFVTQIRSSCGLFLCSWLTYGIAMACLWPRSGKQERSTQVPSFHMCQMWARSGTTLCCYLGSSSSSSSSIISIISYFLLVLFEALYKHFGVFCLTLHSI